MILHRIWGEQRLRYHSWAIQLDPRGDRPRVLGGARRRHLRRRARGVRRPRSPTGRLPRPRPRPPGDARGVRAGRAAGARRRRLPVPRADPVRRGRRPLLLRARRRPRDHRREPDRVAAHAALRAVRASARARCCGPACCTTCDALADEDTSTRRGPEYVPVVVRRWSGDASRPSTRIAAAARDLLGAGRTPTRRATRGWSTASRAWRTRADTTLLLILDQFEEFLLYHGDAWEPGEPARELAARAERPRPAGELPARHARGRARALDRFKGRVPHLFDNYLRLAHLDARRGARGDRPARSSSGTAVTRDDPMEVEPELVDARARRRSATGRIALGRAGGGRAGAAGRPRAASRRRSCSSC